VKNNIIRLLGAISIVVVTSPRSADANAPAGHYVVTAGSGTGNGTVYDTKSKLTWQQTVSLYNVDLSSNTYNWASAGTYCANLGARLGGTGWRLPTIKELMSIVDLSQTVTPMIDTSAFPSTPSEFFWSSSLVVGSPSYRWGVSFTWAVPMNLDMATRGGSYVRCVR
jgi:hypothetical protein